MTGFVAGRGMEPDSCPHISGFIAALHRISPRLETRSLRAGRKPFRLSVEGDTFRSVGRYQVRHCLAVPALNRGRPGAWAARADVGALALSVKREPQHVASGRAVGILVIHGREDAKRSSFDWHPTVMGGPHWRSMFRLLLESCVPQTSFASCDSTVSGTALAGISPNKKSPAEALATSDNQYSCGTRDPVAAEPRMSTPSRVRRASAQR
jgi:hypothetical protein